MWYLFLIFLLGLSTKGIHAADCLPCGPTDIKYDSVSGRCDQFCICLYGSVTITDCPTGLYWSSAALRCVTEDESDCGNGGYCKDVTEPEVVLIAHPIDCSMYIVCHFGTTIFEGRCPNGLFFQEARQWCNFIDFTACIPSGPTSPYPVLPTTPPDTHDPRCADIEGPTYIKHPDDCTKYIECVYGQGFEMTCPYDFHFEEADAVCVTPFASGCIDS